MTDSYPLDEIRNSFPLLADWTYLNTGTVGVMAESVLQKHLGYVAAFERGGHTAQQSAIEQYELSRTALAALLNVSGLDIGFNRNASDGINTVAAAFPLEPGDEVLTSTEEHPAMILPWLAACERNGAHLKYVDVQTDPNSLRQSIADATNARTRIIAISHVSCETGARLPVEVIREAAGDDVAILIDASQSVGQFAVDVPALNADFVIGNGHKWLAGPKGTGFIWLRPESIDLAPPVHFHSETVDPEWSREHYQLTPAPSLSISKRANRFEFGTRAWHIYGALKDAIEFQEQIGWNSIWNHVNSITGYAKAQLGEIPGVEVLTPARWEDSSGIVTFTMNGIDGVSASEKLWNAHRIAQRRVEQPSAVRVSVTSFTSIGDIDRLCEAVDLLAGSK